MIEIPFGFLAFAGLAMLTTASALVVTFSRSIVYSCFALLGTFSGVTGLYLMLSADFVAVTQLLIYVGGVLVLVLFAVMLTNKIEEVHLSNPSINRGFTALLCGVFCFALTRLLLQGAWVTEEEESFHSVVSPIGNGLLTDYLLPFEVVSILLLVVLVGAAVIVRREVRSRCRH